MPNDRKNTGLRRQISPRDGYTIIIGLLVVSAIVLAAMWLETHDHVSWAVPVAVVLCLPVAFRVWRAMDRIDGSEG